MNPTVGTSGGESNAQQPDVLGAMPSQPGVQATPTNPLMMAPSTSSSTDAVAQSQVPVEAATSAEEQVWVEKVKAVLARTTGDPYTRHDVLTQLKAQYLQQRFGKEVGEQGTKT